jgi:hypothetical protein
LRFSENDRRFALLGTTLFSGPAGLPLLPKRRGKNRRFVRKVFLPLSIAPPNWVELLFSRRWVLIRLFAILFAFQMLSSSLTAFIVVPCLASATAVFALAVSLRVVRVVGVAVPHAPPRAGSQG